MDTGNNIGGMRPQNGDSTMVLPITFDYSGGRRESNKSRILWSVILAVLGLIIGIGIIFNKEGFFLANILFGLGFMYMISLIIRFPLLKENQIRRMMITYEDSDYKADFRDIWGIYHIDEDYPYYCRFRNGSSGLFVSLNKDVVLGKYNDAEYEHYEAIADAYNLVGAGGIKLCHVDYMDNVGSDERIHESFVKLSEVENPDIKDILTDIFTYQQSQMMGRVTTFDVYLFVWNGNDISAWNDIQKILRCFLDANYVSYHIMSSSDLRSLFKTLNNVHDFSVMDAMSNSFIVKDSSGVVPIKLIKSNGEEVKLNKTQEELRVERELREKEAELKKQELKKRKNKNKKKKNNEKEEKEEEFDLFE